MIKTVLSNVIVFIGLFIAVQLFVWLIKHLVGKVMQRDNKSKDDNYVNAGLFVDSEVATGHELDVSAGDGAGEGLQGFLEGVIEHIGSTLEGL